MTVLTLILALVIIAFVLWAVNAYAPDPLRKIANYIIIALLVIWVIVVLFPGVANIRIGH